MVEPVYFEDVAVGMTFRTASIPVDTAAIIAFARDFDPQPYHLDEEAALASPFKGLAASGWHTAALVMRMLVDARPFGGHPILGLGVDELRWLAPVRPGDVLRVEGEVLGLDASNAKRGTVRARFVALNQRDEPVLSMVPMMILPRRTRT